jgi:hypothetical protein
MQTPFCCRFSRRFCSLDDAPVSPAPLLFRIWLLTAPLAPLKVRIMVLMVWITVLTVQTLSLTRRWSLLLSQNRTRAPHNSSARSRLPWKTKLMDLLMTAPKVGYRPVSSQKELQQAFQGTVGRDVPED